MEMKKFPEWNAKFYYKLHANKQTAYADNKIKSLSELWYIYEYIAHSQSQFLTPVFIISVFRFWNYYAKQKVLTESHTEHILLFWSHTITGFAHIFQKNYE